MYFEFNLIVRELLRVLILSFSVIRLFPFSENPDTENIFVDGEGGWYDR